MTGVVTVYEGRREFKSLVKAARRARAAEDPHPRVPALPDARGRSRRQRRLRWAAQQILARRLAEERPSDPVEYAASVHRETQALRYRAHDKLMGAFLDDDVFDGHIRSTPPPRARQASLLDYRDPAA